MHRSSHPRGALLLPWLAGATAGMLLARLVARLLAARPDNPAFALLYAVTDPLVAPLAFLDRGQPPYGAILELSTLVMAMIVPALAYLAWVWATRRATRGRSGAS